MSIFLFLSVVGLPALMSARGIRVGESIVRSYLALFLLMAVSTELLSVAGAVTYGTLSLLWAAFAIATLVSLRSTYERRGARELIEKWLDALRPHGWVEVVLLSFVVLILLLTLVVALAYPPNNWDSMTYHMARVAEWIQRGSVHFYPTSIDRQNYQPPLAEFAILHLQLLSGSDRFANLVQWYSFFVAIVLTMLISGELGVSRLAQLTSGVVAATVPMAILQSSSTQNDLVTAALCLCFAYFLLRTLKTRSPDHAVSSAVGYGLALLAKGTAYVYCAAIGIALGGVALLTRAEPKRLSLLGTLGGIAIGGLVLNVGHAARNHQLYGLRAPSNASSITNEVRSPPIVLANLVRNAALHAGTPVEGLNRITVRGVEELLGEHVGDPRSTMATTSFDVPFSLHEDLAGNLPHLLLATLALLVLPFLGAPNARTLLSYAAALGLGAVLFSAVLKWQPWASRLHTPLFMLSAPLVAAVLAQVRHARWILPTIAALLFGYSLPFLTLNATRPFGALLTDGVLSPEQRLRSYFVNRRELYDDYREAARIILEEGVESVGLCMGYDDYEYPLWVLTGGEATRGRPAFRHVGVEDASSVKEAAGLPPPALIVSTKRLDADPIRGVGRQAVSACLEGEYEVIYDSATISVSKRV